MKMLRRLFPLGARMPRSLQVFGLAVQEKMRAGVVERQGAKHFMLVFFHTEALLAVNGARKVYPANSLIIWPPGHEHVYGNPNESWNHSWIVLDGARFFRQLQRLNIPLGTVLPGVDASVVEHYLLSIHRELASRARPDVVIVRNILQNWLRELKRSGGADARPRAIPRKYAAIKRELEELFDRPISLQMLARKAYVSRWHLCREFKKYFGLSPIDCLLRNRMQHAAHLLRDHRLNVSEIARQVGYEDVFHFSKLFKKYYGVSPRNMRKDI